MKFNYGTQEIIFDITYSKRKSIEIGVEPPDIVSIVAPIGVTDAIILRHVKKKAKWIVQKLYEIREIEHRRLNKEYVNGEAFMYLGRNYSLQIIQDDMLKQPVTKLYRGRFYIHTPTKDQDKLKHSMEVWYRHKTDEKIREKVNYFQKYFEEVPNSIKVKEQKKRWASCSAHYDLLFNWRCSMAPSWVMDYIVVHEMCHMIHMDHSKAFWAIVERILPDYIKRREWLKNYGIKMDL